MRDELLSIWPMNGTIKTVLDLGCRDCWHTAGLPGVMRHIGLDIWPAALERGKLKAMGGGIPHFEPVGGDAIEYLLKCENASIDAVLAIDLLEHLRQENALELLEQMNRVASNLAVIWTTLGWIDQGPYDVDGNYNSYEQHRWGPLPITFASRDWQVRSYPAWHEARGGALLAWRYIRA